MHFTPTYGSWINQVERWGLLEQGQIKRGSHRSVVALVRAIKEFVEVSNENARPFQWGFFSILLGDRKPDKHA